MKHAHNLSYTRLASFDMGELIPIGVQEVLPGDLFFHSTAALVRLQQQLAPIMHPIDVGIAHFFVPYRLLWTEWEDFITGGPNGTSAPLFPTFSLSIAPAAGSLHNHLGLPVGMTGSYSWSAMPARAYGMIWNEFFRDQDLDTPVTVSTASSGDSTTNQNLLNVSWKKDVFTAARPWEQKGPATTIPLLGTAPVKGIGTGTTTSPTASAVAVKESGTLPDRTYTNAYASALAGFAVETESGAVGAKPTIFADLAAASGVSIIQLREALALQRIKEARARYGSRYVEYLEYLGVNPRDGRLRRPEYLAGGTTTIQFSEVLQTAEGSGTQVGQMRGHGIGFNKSNKYRRMFEEHGLVLSLMWVRPDNIYLQGIERFYNRLTKEDFWQKELEHIGADEVYVREVYGLSGATRANIFGYNDRYYDYRARQSRVSGEFASTLNFWHMARDFSSSPVLNASFVSCVPTKRNFPVTTADVVYAQVRHTNRARRLVSPRSKVQVM